MLTLERLRQVDIPLNVSNKPNNLSDFKRGVGIYNDSVNLYDALELYFSGSPGSSTDLSSTPSATTVVINSSTGADATITAATTSLAGVMTATDKINLTGLITLSGVSAGSTGLGTFTGSIISDNTTIKNALQQLETYVQVIPVITKGNLTPIDNKVAITNGTNAVIGTGTTIGIVPSNILLSSLGGSLALTQLSGTGATNGQFLIYNGTNWAATTYTPSTPLHNDLLGKQGGTSGEYYHLTASLYNQLIDVTADKLLGRAATDGIIQEIGVTNSIEFSSGNLRLVNDVASPGNNKYFGTNGSGVRGWQSFTTSGTVTEVQVTDTSDIDFTVTNPTTTPNLSATLTNSGVSAGTYGGAATVPTITVDLKGRITNTVNTAISIASTSISDFSEAVDDRLNSLLVAGSGISLTYNDVANTLTIANTAALTGVTNRIAWWLNPTTLTTDDDLRFDGTYLTVGNPVTSSISRISSKGTGATLSTYGYVHLNSGDVEVFKVADNGALTIGALGDVYIHPDQTNISAGGTYIISKSGGDLGLYSDTTVYAESGDTATNTPSFKSIATRSTSIGNVLNAEIKGTFNTASGSNRYTDLYIDTQVNQTGGTSPIRSIYINPTLTSATNYAGIEVNAPGHHAIRTTAGYVRFDLGSDATGDIYYRDASGNLARLPIGTSSQVLGSTGTVPAWTTTSGSLPGGSAGDFLIYSGGNWTAASQLKEKQSGITGTNMTLASPPLASTPIYIYKNGVLQDDPDDYSISGTTVTFVNALVSADKIISIYFI